MDQEEKEAQNKKDVDDGNDDNKDDGKEDESKPKEQAQNL